MKKIFVLFFIVLMASCASQKGINSISDVMGKNLKLVEVQVQDRNIIFDRAKLAKEDAVDIFTINVSTDKISGKGAPNTFSTPCKQGNDRSLTVTSINVTSTVPLRQPEKLRENDFFTYLQNAKKWNAVNNYLELQANNEDGSTIKLLFSL